MINLHRNFYVENILSELNYINSKDYKNLPYSENLNFLKNDKLALLFIDIDRYKNPNNFIKDLNNIKYYQSLNVLILSSKNKLFLDKIEKKINQLNINNLILINIYKIGIINPIDITREKILKTYLKIETQIELINMINKITTLFFNKDIRLISLDLDNTSWNGIVGEDGINKINLDANQKRSLFILNSLINKGILLSIHSKNNKKIALDAIKKKFSAYKYLQKRSFKFIGWESKLKTIKEAVKLVNFSTKHVIFLDDDIANIKQVETFLGSNNCLWIKNSYFFYIYIKVIFFINKDKQKNITRYKDIKSNLKREKIKTSSGLFAYIRSAKLKVIIKTNQINYDRCVEMSKKTNQFNANYKRYEKKDLKKLYADKNFKIVTCSVEDKYSDSGIVGLIVLEKQINNKYIIDEFTISCRALGRGLENYFIFLILKKFKMKDLFIKYIKTERNIPFINFVNSVKKEKTKKMYSIDIVKLNNKVKNYDKWIRSNIN